MSRPVIPSYDLYRGDELSLPFKFLLLDKVAGSYNASEPHRHNYYEIFYFQKGGGWHDIDFQTYPIRDGSVHFVVPGQVHQVRRDPLSHGMIVLFTSEFYVLSLNNQGAGTDIPFPSHIASIPVLYPEGEELDLFISTLRMIQAESGSDRRYRDEILRSYLNILLAHARRLFEQQSGPADEGGSTRELITRLRTLIEQNFTTEHAPGSYAAMLNVSQNHLNSTVRQSLGTTVSDMVHERIILEAKRLLFHTDLSIKEIAYQLNYDDPSYFTRFFRKQSGLSPNEFRENARAEHR
jgi:AraC-like DNA-binding protein